MARTGTPPREKAYVYRTGRPDRLRPLLFAVAALILCAGIGAVLWHEWQGTRPTAAEQAEADEIERADGGEEMIAAVTEEAADGKIVVAIDPGHGGVNPSVGSEDAGSLGSGLREEDVLSLIHISEPTRRTPISYAVFCLKKKKKEKEKTKKKKQIQT